MKALILLCALLQSVIALGATAPAGAPNAVVSVATATPVASAPLAVAPAGQDGGCIQVPVPAFVASIAQVTTGNKVLGLLGLLLVICRTLSEIMGQGGGLLEQRYPQLAKVAWFVKLGGWLVGKFGFGTPTIGATMPAKPTPPPDQSKAA